MVVLMRRQSSQPGAGHVSVQCLCFDNSCRGSDGPSKEVLEVNGRGEPSHFD